jgi:hypothetical protein
LGEGVLSVVAEAFLGGAVDVGIGGGVLGAGGDQGNRVIALAEALEEVLNDVLDAAQDGGVVP